MKKPSRAADKYPHGVIESDAYKRFISVGYGISELLSSGSDQKMGLVFEMPLVVYSGVCIATATEFFSVKFG